MAPISHFNTSFRPLAIGAMRNSNGFPVADGDRPGSSWCCRSSMVLGGDDQMKNLLFLSLIVVMIAVPTRMAGRPTTRGPQRTVSFYLGFCAVYYLLLRFVVQRVA